MKATIDELKVVQNTLLAKELGTMASAVQRAITALETNRWKPIGDQPANRWLYTRREGEKGWNICMWFRHDSEAGEWVEFGSGRDTIVHSTFLPPTHWAPTNPPGMETTR